MTGDSPVPRDPLADALAELRDDFAPAADETDDRYWLRVGLTLGLRRPGRAGLLLERLEDGTAPAGARATAGAGAGAAAGAGAGAAAGAGVAADATDATSADAADADPTDLDPGAIPVRSMLLARAAVLPLDEPAETAFGWVGRLTAADVTYMGRVVAEQIASGGSADLGRGFGLAWSSGVRLPNAELNLLFGRFTDLEVAIASVLGGQDLRGIPQAGGLEGISNTIQGWFMPKRSAAGSAAAAVFDGRGKPAQHGLVAAWNAWAAMRFRELLPTALFEQLTQPWVTVVGRLPEA
jgi:hypothetical protein